MKILLLGEYSRLHNSLKEGLTALGHEVQLFGFSDGFKNYPVDFLFEKKWDQGWKKKIKLLLLKITGFDLTSYLTYLQFWRQRHRFSGFDVVQLINENTFFCDYHHERAILAFIFQNNSKTFLLSCGDDTSYVSYCFKNREYKSVVQPYFEGKIPEKHFFNTLKFQTKHFQKLHTFLLQHVAGIIASDMDYHLPLRETKHYLGMISNPINLDSIPLIAPTPLEKVIIFHGINSENYYRKGNDYFEKALQILSDKYGDTIEIVTSRDVPYSTYIASYNQCHILLDQCYAQDQGYNALEAMAKGKVVFTGAEEAFLAYYGLTEDAVCINAKPDVHYLVAKLSWLIEHPEQIVVIGQNARRFIEEQHHYVKIAQQYLDRWQGVTF